MYVRRHPDLWLWMHRRWRDEGNGAASEPERAMFPAGAADDNSAADLTPEASQD
jgi:hypothetical protein